MVFLLVAIPLRSIGSSYSNDSIVVASLDYSYYDFNWKKLIVPAVLIAGGCLGIENGWFKGIKEQVKTGMSGLRGENYYHIDDWAQYAPAVAYFGLGFAIQGKNNINCRDRILVEATAFASMTIIVQTTKFLISEPRPDTGALNSFPSGHTATAFTGAELMRIEYGPWIGLCGYAMSSGIAFLRLYNERHWMNDIIAGAGIGILCARIGYWLMPLERKLFKLGAKPKQASGNYALTPMIATQQVGLSLILSF